MADYSIFREKLWQKADELEIVMNLIPLIIIDNGNASIDEVIRKMETAYNNYCKSIGRVAKIRKSYNYRNDSIRRSRR